MLGVHGWYSAGHWGNGPVPPEPPGMPEPPVPPLPPEPPEPPVPPLPPVPHSGGSSVFPRQLSHFSQVLMHPVLGVHVGQAVVSPARILSTVQFGLRNVFAT